MKINRDDHPAGTRLLCRRDLSRSLALYLPTLFELTVVEWSPAGALKARWDFDASWIASDRVASCFDAVEVLSRPPSIP